MKVLSTKIIKTKNVNDRIMQMSDAVSSKVFDLVPYAVISPVSLNLLMMLCTVDDEIYEAFAI